MNIRRPADRDDSEHSETRLLRRIVERDQEALEELYVLYYPKLSRFLLRLLGASGQQALPGLINETLFVVWNRADSYNHTSKVSSWVFGIALRIAKKQQSTQFSYETRQQELAQDLEFAGEPWESGLERADLLSKAIQRLSCEQKAVIELTYFNGLHYSEIAEIMGCPENTVKTRMYHARLRLRTLLRELEEAVRSE
ncbi:MAG: RNA polymerase sigma factor [Gammaproteobacteria bacterium]|jgi:RNA polymerase sigma-70 factor (ECF subfamily)